METLYEVVIPFYRVLLLSAWRIFFVILKCAPSDDRRVRQQNEISPWFSSVFLNEDAAHVEKLQSR